MAASSSSTRSSPLWLSSSSAAERRLARDFRRLIKKQQFRESPCGERTVVLAGHHESAGEIASAVYSLPSSEVDRHHSVRLVVSTGMPGDIWRAFEERYGISVLEWFGTIDGAFACNPAGAGPVGSFGRPPAGVGEMDVIGDDGDPLPARTLGELVFRSAGGAAWSRTGETAIRDEDGWFYAAYRLRDECRPERMSA